VELDPLNVLFMLFGVAIVEASLLVWLLKEAKEIPFIFLFCKDPLLILILHTTRRLELEKKYILIRYLFC